eukprot:TRINITY_DN94644_c0_g1_i1.p1 TRINITY_DN94644_c0_g1~~TRINITY_DN94644_c0_g1_i1.p1  ORF type:complete len:436 (-),score=49.45 TRINITY_DN94644_c0_g1_i1:89-1219(-)
MDWSRFVSRLIDRVKLRIPKLFASYMVEPPQSYPDPCSKRPFVMVVERFAEPLWKRVDPFVGCNEDQARACIDAIAGFQSSLLNRGVLESAMWLPHLPIGLKHNTAAHTRWLDCFKVLSPILEGFLSEATYECCQKLCKFEAFGSEMLGRLMRPPVTVLHGNFHPGLNVTPLAWSGLRFGKTVFGPPSIAALDWGCVCKGRGVYDMAVLMALGLSTENRREWEPWMTVMYMDRMSTKGSEEAQQAFHDDFRASILVCLMHYLEMHCASFQAFHQLHPDAKKLITMGLKRLDSIIEDWEAIDVIGGSDRPKVIIEERVLVVYDPDEMTRSTRTKNWAMSKAEQRRDPPRPMQRSISNYLKKKRSVWIPGDGIATYPL